MAVGESQPSPDEQLARLEDDIRKLRVEFDIFFNGAAKRPPYDTKSRVETLLKRLGDDRTLTFAQRYRYNSLAARYNAFRDLWRRTMQGREEGRDPVSAARASVKQEQPTAIAPVSFVCADAHKEVGLVKELVRRRWSQRSKRVGRRWTVSPFRSFIDWWRRSRMD